MAVEWTSENSQSGKPKFYLKDGETTLATVSGVKNTVALPTFVASVDVSGTTITVNDGSIIDETSKTLTVTGSSGYKLAVGSTLNSQASGPNSLTWAVSNNGTATTTASFSKVYELISAGTEITYSDSGKAVTFTLKGLKSDVTADQLNGKEAPGEDQAIVAAATFKKDDGVIELNTDVFGSGNITIESSLPGVIYELEATGVKAATVGEKGWYRKENNTKATYDQHITGEKGDYYSTGTTITKLTKKATDEKPFVINYATLNGLGKENDEVEGEEIDGITVEGKTIKISQDLLSEGTDTLIKANEAKGIEGKTGVKKLTLKSNDYEFALYAGTGNPEDDEDDDEIVEVPTPETNAKWNLGYKTKNEEDTGTGTWTLTQKTSDGWSIVKDKKTGKAMTIQYVAEKTETLATISGLTTNLEGFSTAFDNVTDNGHVITGTTVKKGTGNDAINVISISDDEITLNPALYNGKAITLKSSKYKFAEACNSPATEITDDAAKWTVNKSGKAVLTGGTTAAYTVDSTGKKIALTKANSKTLATISGLGKNLTTEQITELEGYLNDAVITAPTYKKDPTTNELTTELASAGTIKLNKDMLQFIDTTDSKKVKVTVGSKDPYKLLLDTTTDGKEVTTAGVTGGAWELETKKDAPTGKATYKASVTEGFSLSGDGKTVTYTAVKSDVILATLSGLDKSKLTNKVATGSGDNTGSLVLKGDEDAQTPLITVADNKITLLQALKDNELITKKVSIKNENGGTFALALGTGLGQEDTDGDWDVSKGTAVYASGKKPGYELDTKETTATYKSSASNTMLATVKGLAKTATTSDIAIGTGENAGKIVVAKAALGTSNVTLTNGADQTYKLALGTGVETSNEAKNYWTIGNGKATYANGVPAYYAVNDTGTTITYKKAGSATTLAAVTGLNKEVTDADVEFDENDNHVIVIKEAALPYETTDEKVTKTKIALKGDGYSLALDSELNSSKAETTAAWGTPDKGKATLTNKVTKAGFVVTDTSITYGAADSETTLATLSGVKGTISAPVNGVTTITSSNVNEAKIAIKGDGYTLELDSNGTAPTVKSLANGEAGAWNTKSGTATLSGKTKAGYLQTDPNTITYVKALGTDTKDVAIATIKGVKAVDFDDETESTTTGEGQDATTTGKYVSYADSTMTFTNKVGDALSTNITVDGKGVVKFNFAAYSDASITGGSSNDSFTFGGTGLTITPGKGADYVKLGTTTRGEGKADTFVYASGDGYDKVADFTTGDSLKINKAKKIEVTHDETNTYVNVDGKGTITLDAFEYSGINISGAASASLMSSGNDLDSDTTGIQDILVVPSTGVYTDVNFDKDFTLSKTSAFNATISFTKKD